jgi:anti-sigma factor RsiW
MDHSWIEKIDAYLHGTMSPDERAAFEAELAVNEELSSLLEIYRAIENDMSAASKYCEEEDRLRNTLSNLNAAYFSGNAQRPATPLPTNRHPVLPVNNLTHDREPSGLRLMEKEKRSNSRKGSGWSASEQLWQLPPSFWALQ